MYTGSGNQAFTWRGACERAGDKIPVKNEIASLWERCIAFKVSVEVESGSTKGTPSLTEM